MSGYFYSGSAPTMKRRAASLKLPPLVPTTASVKAQWGTPGAGYAPGFFAPPKSKSAQGLFGGAHGYFQDPVGPPGGSYSQGGETIQLDDSGNWTGKPPLTDRERAKAAIEGDPEYVLGLQNLQEWLDTNRRNMRSGIQQGVIGLGVNPLEGAKDLGFDMGQYGEDITPETLATAALNPYSTRAVQERQRVGTMGDLVNTLAARGGIRSGGVYTGGDQIKNTYSANMNQALRDLLGTLQGNITSSAEAERAQRDAWLTRKSSIAARLGLSDWAGSVT